MATRTTIERICDSCEVVLSKSQDGLVFCGALWIPDGKGGLMKLFGDEHDHTTEHALCWACFGEFVSRSASPRPQKAPQRPKTPVETSFDEPVHDHGYRGGPSGPLPPPELPSFVRKANALIHAWSQEQTIRGARDE